MSSEGKIRSFALLLQGLEDGQVLQDLTDKTSELSLKLLKHAEQVSKAKGEIVLKLKFNADATSVEIVADIAVKEPKMLRTRTLAWFNKDGSLSGQNPKQQLLPLREVPAAKETKQAPAEDAGARSV